MLETALAARYEPGSNVKGDAAGANWRFLLPSLELGRVVSLGGLPPASLAALERSSSELLVVDPAAAAAPLAALPDESIDLVTAVGRGPARRLARDARLQEQVARVLGPRGRAYVEPAGRGPLALAGLAELERLQLSPPVGEVRAAAPRGDRAAVAYLERLSREDSGVFRPRAERVRRHAAEHPLRAGLRPRLAVLAGRPGAARSGELPEYLRTVAGSAGVNLAGRRFAFAAPGRYGSKKALFFVFEGSADTPAAIVKITRDPAFNERLENEHRALALLEERGLAVGTAPRSLFFGRHGGLALLGETVVEGAPFRDRTRAAPDCPLVLRAVDWLLELAAATAEPAAPADVAGALEALLEQFVDIYRATPAERDFLAVRIDRIAASREPFPLVFQHGDPGTWNARVTPDGRVAFLDWEAAEPRGLPLWDLFYFLRTVGTLAAGGSRARDGVLADPGLARLQWEAAARLCDAIGLGRELAGPLFYTCWMHRALKEATRLPAERVGSGRYATVLRQYIERRDASELAGLLSPPQGR